MLGIVFELVRRGHAVRFTAPAVFAERITETGTRFCTGLPRETLGCNTIPQMHGAELARALQQSAHVMSRRSAVPAASTGATACMWALSPTGRHVAERHADRAHSGPTTGLRHANTGVDRSDIGPERVSGSWPSRCSLRGWPRHPRSHGDPCGRR
jgi:hypothetical protein